MPVRATVCMIVGIVIAGLSGTSPALARTWYILPDGSGDAPTIQAGIDSTVFGDVVLVAAGTYVESLVMDLGITLRGESGAASTVINALPGTSCVRCEGLSSVLLEGLTLAGGRGTLLGRLLAGGNLFVYQSQIEVRDCVIRHGALHGDPLLHDRALGGGIACIDGSIANLDGCSIEDNATSGEPKYGPIAEGGGIYVDASSEMELRECRVAGNQATLRGGGIASDSPVLTAVNCLIESNLAQFSGGGFCGAGILRQCVVRGNRAGGISASAGGILLTQGLVEHCLIVRNITGILGGGGIHAENRSGGDITLRGNTLFGNVMFEPSIPIDGAGIFVAWDPSVAGALVLENNLVAADGAPGISSGVIIWGCPPSRTIRCNNSWGHDSDFVYCDDPAADGNFSADPLFCEPEAGDFTLDTHSPCLPGQHPGGEDCGLVGAFDLGCGNPSASDPVSWGHLKHGFGSTGK